MEYYSPLRYPGGKGRVADYFKKIIRDNLLFDGIYVEPYAGGASVALSLLFNEYVARVIINDIDRSIFAFWHSVLNETGKLCDLVQKTPVTVAMWKKQKKIQKERNQCSLLEVGFSTFFLNRTNRSGILNGGIIGGLEQKGNWKINARYNKPELIKRIRRIAEYSDRIELHNRDALELIKELRSSLPKNTLFYFDPPYFVKGKDLYLNSYELEDHLKIASAIGNIRQQKWVVTYDNVNAIRRMYNGYRKIKYDLNYSASQASKGEEVMIFSRNLYVKRSRPVLTMGKSGHQLTSR